MKYLKLGVTIILSALMVACSTQTKVVNRWMEESASGRDMGKTLVISITQDETVRRTLESAYVKALKEYGVEAVPSYTIFQSEKDVSKDSVKPVVKEQGFNSVLVTLFKGVDEQTIYHSPTYTYTPGPYYGHMWGYYGHAHSAVMSPGYYATYKTVLLESNLYDAATEKLIWTVATETEEDRGRMEVINSKVQLVMKELSRTDLLPKKKSG